MKRKIEREGEIFTGSPLEREKKTEREGEKEGGRQRSENFLRSKIFLLVPELGREP